MYAFIFFNLRTLLNCGFDTFLLGQNKVSDRLIYLDYGLHYMWTKSPPKVSC